MRPENLSGADAAVFEAVAKLENQEGGPHLQDLVRETGLSADEVKASLHRLTTTTEPSLVHEVPDTSGTDLGPYYEVSPRT